MDRRRYMQFVATLEQLEVELMSETASNISQLPELGQAIEQLYTTFRLVARPAEGGSVESRLREMSKMQRAVELLRAASAPRANDSSAGCFRFTELMETAEAAVSRFPASAAS